MRVRLVLGLFLLVLGGLVALYGFYIKNIKYDRPTLLNMAFVEHACTVVSHEYRDEPGGGISMLVILIVSGPDFVFPLYAVKNGTIHDVNKAKFLQPEGSKVPGAKVSKYYSNATSYSQSRDYGLCR